MQVVQPKDEELDALYTLVRFWTDLANTSEHGACWACGDYMLHPENCTAMYPRPNRYLRAS